VSQRELILLYLEAHGSITPLEALQHCGCFRLAARIRELREEGKVITTKIETTGDIQKVNFARYELAPINGRLFAS
jgi:hypothetical protein